MNGIAIVRLAAVISLPGGIAIGRGILLRKSPGEALVASGEEELMKQGK